MMNLWAMGKVALLSLISIRTNLSIALPYSHILTPFLYREDQCLGSLTAQKENMSEANGAIANGSWGVGEE